MSCCGRRRLARSTPPARAEAPTPRPAAPEVAFRYAGTTAITVVGPATGRVYRFGGPGAVVAVDARDALGVAAVPVLRRA